MSRCFQQTGYWSVDCYSEQCKAPSRKRDRAVFVEALDVACDGDKPCSLVILHYTNHLSTVYWISYYKEPILRARRVAHRMLSGPNNIRMMHGRRPSKVYSWRIRGGNVKDISADTLPTKSLLRRELCGKMQPQQPGEKTLTNTLPFQTFTISGEECSLLWLQTITTVAPEINEKNNNNKNNLFS